MTKRYVLTPAAKSDLAEISSYIRRKNGARRAAAIIKQLHDVMQKIAVLSEQGLVMGHSREDLSDDDVLFWPIYNYLVVYIPDTDPLEVVRVMHGARDVKTILEEDQ